MTALPGTLAEAARLIAAKALSPVELTQAALSRAEALNPSLHAFIRITGDLALRQAREAEARQMAGALRGKLDGIPVAHKDLYETAGVETTAHSRILLGHVPVRDAAPVAAWAAGGAVMLGKLATHEFASGGPSFDLPWPPPRNPWDTERATGGSSSGTGAAVAAGIILGGTGSDTGGSIRLPAAWCGIAGVKPTFGLCSRRGVLPLSHSLDTVGPMAWTLEDCAILLQALAGHDPEDPSSADRPTPDLVSGLGQGVRGLRIGVVRHFHESDLPARPSVLAGIDHLVSVLRAEGAEVRDITLPPLRDFHAACWVVLMAEALAIHQPWLQTRFQDYGRNLRERLSIAALITGADYVQAQRRRRELCEAVAAAMADCDLLVTAGQPGEAPPLRNLGTWATLQGPNFTAPFNVTGQPVVSVCTGYGEGGLPVGAQIVGRPFEDALALRAGHAFERATAGERRRPGAGS
ncbi:amidase [Falsiroseomonas ponticola]|uniref:amidase n=1 Tax=Falsiroseomonas ponticola TaxID=2786951 RepID=UPI0019345695|nr:amidase [Roseomonas ponticola]